MYEPDDKIDLSEVRYNLEKIIKWKLTKYQFQETTAVLNYEIEQMSFISSFPSLQLKWLTLLLIQESHPIMIELKDFQAVGKSLFKGIVSLL